MGKKNTAQASGRVEAVASSYAKGEGMIAEAYALLPDGIGRFKAVRLENVIAERTTPLEPEGRGEPFAHGAERISMDMLRRSRKRVK